LSSKKTIQEYLQEENFYDRLNDLKLDLSYFGLNNYEYKFTFESSQSWKIFYLKEYPFFHSQIFKPLGLYREKEVTSIRANLRYNENQLKELKETGGVTIYKVEDGGVVTSHKSSDQQSLQFSLFHCRVGEENNPILHQDIKSNISIDELFMTLREKVFWFLQHKKS